MMPGTGGNRTAGCKAKKKMKSGPWFYLLGAYWLTVPLVFVAERFESSSDLLAYLKVVCLVSFGAYVVRSYRSGWGDAHTPLVLGLAIGLTWACLFTLQLYKSVTHIPLTFSFAISSLDDTRRTLHTVLGPFGVAYAAAGFLVILSTSSVAACALLRILRRRLRVPLRPLPVLACVGVLSYLSAGDIRYVIEELLIFRRLHVNELPLRSPDYSTLPIRSGESVFMLQLESVNSAVLFERTPVGGVRPRVAMPGLQTIVREGGAVLFPFFWANGMQTNRAQESILCAISGNTGHAISHNPARLVYRTCLPRQLAGAGFATVFLYSYFDLDFFNFAEFQKAVGFQDLVYGTELMAQGDRRHLWGYDDCVFYERAFDYLERRGLGRRERLFAYFEVGMHHVPFFNTNKYPGVHPYRTPATPNEHYVNSLAEQDHCLEAFWNRFKALARDDVHLIIIPDHSIWTGEAAGDADGVFTTWMAYVPPARRRDQFTPRAVLAPMPSQAQIYPTVLELLGAPRTRESFAFALRGEPTPDDYDDCHVLADPYARLLVVGTQRRAEFLLQTESARFAKDVTEKMDYRTFQKRFGCAQ
jgi:hypothetical protein